MYTINALLLDIKDNVVTCVKDVACGEAIFYRVEDEVLSLKAEMDIPYCHKIALANINKDETVIKYGEMIGKATEFIPKGHCVNEHNIVSVPRDYDSELI